MILERDDFIKPGTDMQTLGGLRASFQQMGDFGYDAVAPGNEQIGKNLGLTPKARVLSVAVTATEPTIMLTGPDPAAKKALAKAGLTADDMDLVEINEAFAGVVLRLQKDPNVPDEKLNVLGGAIAIGHPPGPDRVLPGL